MSDLRDLLRAAADPPAPDELDPVDLRRRGRRLRHTRRGVAAVLVVLVALGGWAIARPATRDSGVEFIDNPVGGPADPAWTPLPAGPLSPRWGSYAAWTGDEFVVWGGYAGAGTGDERSAADGAAYDPSTGGWRVIADAPLDGMRRGQSVWTGTELWVLGGHGDPNGRMATTAAAAYAPDSDTWHGLPDAPAPLRAAVWSPETREAVVVGSGAKRAGPRGVWALGADDDGWRELPATPTLPGELDPDHPPLSLVAGDGHAYLVATDVTWRMDLRDPSGWERLPDRPVTDASAEAPLGAWTDAGMLLVGLDGSAVYDPTADGGTWTTLPPPPIRISFDWFEWSLLAVDGGAIAVDLRSGTVAALDAATARWSTLPDVPVRPRWSAAVAGGVDGDATVTFVWAGSDDADLPFVDGALLRVRG